GTGREPAPGSQEVFGELTRAWIDTGAACPTG
ncbi:Isoquinoline 1-oxidoreductase subunit, partial [Cribrihabitans sp. XS_ASV171]